MVGNRAGKVGEARRETLTPPSGFIPPSSSGGIGPFRADLPRANKPGGGVTPRISILNVTKRFGDTVAVDQLNLNIFPGEVFAFLGPNGAGKTTTIKLLVGLLSPTSGSVVVDGMDLVRFPVEVKRLIGYVPDESYLYEKLTGAEFMEFVGTLYGLPRKECLVRRDELLEIFHLAPMAHRLIETYSHGMRQRLVYASVLLHDPRLLVVDEPTVGLDPEGMKLMRERFRELARNGGTVFLSTHVLSLAEAIADRVGIIHQGRLIACGTLAELTQLHPGLGSLEELFLRLVKISPDV